MTDIYQDNEEIKQNFKRADKQDAKPVELGVAINIETPEKNIAPFIKNIDVIQCMGIAKIGYQGNPFDDRVLAKIKDLQGKYPRTAISVDGGVNLDTAPKLISAGATRLVAGSAIFKSKNIEKTIEGLAHIT